MDFFLLLFLALIFSFFFGLFDVFSLTFLWTCFPFLEVFGFDFSLVGLFGRVFFVLDCFCFKKCFVFSLDWFSSFWIVVFYFLWIVCVFLGFCLPFLLVGFALFWFFLFLC